MVEYIFEFWVNYEHFQNENSETYFIILAYNLYTKRIEKMFKKTNPSNLLVNAKDEMERLEISGIIK